MLARWPRRAVERYVSQRDMLIHHLAQSNGQGLNISKPVQMAEGKIKEVATSVNAENGLG